MSKFELTILGSNSAMPAHGRWPTSQVLSLDKNLILLDCGEGAQIRMSQYKIKRNKISHVLISHLHGDHIYGLPGFLGSLSHLSRSQPLFLYGPVGLKEYLTVLQKVSQSYLSYELIVTELDFDQPELIVQEGHFSITAFPVNHRISTYGYLIRENEQDKRIRKEAIKAYQLSIEEIIAVKKGADITRNGNKLPNRELTFPLSKRKSYAYCADTMKTGWKSEHLKGVDLVYFETTYLHELVELAQERKHMTARQAAELAKELEIGQLVIGHYSSRYKDVDALVNEAKAVFSRVHKGYDGFILNI